MLPHVAGPFGRTHNQVRLVEYCEKLKKDEKISTRDSVWAGVTACDFRKVYQFRSVPPSLINTVMFRDVDDVFPRKFLSRALTR